MNKIQKLGASLLGIKAYYAPGVSMLLGGAFNWNFKNKTGQLSKGYENKIVYAVVNVLVRKLIEAPLIVSKVKSEKDLARVKSYNFGYGNATGEYNIRQIKALEELQQHALLDLLNNPNEYQTGIEMREAFWFNYQLTGDGFLFAELNGDKPVFIHCLPSDRVTIKREGDDWRRPVTGYTFSAWDGTHIPLPIENVMHLKKWSPLDPLQGGFSPLQAAGSAVAKNDQNDIAQGSAFKNGGTGTIISSDVIVQEGATYSKLSVEQLKKIQQTVDTKWAGAHNSGGIHVTNGAIKVDKWGDTLVDLNAIEADNQDAVRIAASWGVNSILIGDKTGGTENNVKEAYKTLVTNVIVSELRKFDQKFKVFAKNWYRGERLDISHDLTEFSELAPDLVLMNTVFNRNTGPLISEDERRGIFKFDAIGGSIGKAYLVPSGLMKIEDVLDDIDDTDTNEDFL